MKLWEWNWGRWERGRSRLRPVSLENEVVEYELRTYGKKLGCLPGRKTPPSRATPIGGASRHLRGVPRTGRGIPLGTQRARLTAGTSAVRCIRFPPDGQRLRRAPLE